MEDFWTELHVQHDVRTGASHSRYEMYRLTSACRLCREQAHMLIIMPSYYESQACQQI